MALIVGGRAPFDMQLHVAEAVLGADVALAARDGHDAVLDQPFGGPALFRLPCVQTRAVEQHHRIGWRRAFGGLDGFGDGLPDLGHGGSGDALLAGFLRLGGLLGDGCGAGQGDAGGDDECGFHE